MGRDSEATLTDFVAMLLQMRRNRQWATTMEGLPGLEKVADSAGELIAAFDFDRVERILNAMSNHELGEPATLSQARIVEVAREAEVEVREITDLCDDFAQYRQTMRQLNAGSADWWQSAYRGFGPS